MSIESRPGWRDFWNADCLGSCVPDKPETAKQIGDFWEAWFAAIPDTSRILDVATGNGIVLGYAASSARANERVYELTGVDLAKIDPKKHVSNFDEVLRGASFRGGVAAEKLPFPDRCFDVVVSQYGLEYADLPRALAEVARVLVPGGTLLWLAHSVDSEIVGQHRNQVAEIDYLLSARGPIYVMNKFVERQRRRKDLEYSRDLLAASFSEAQDYSREHPPASIVRETCGEFSALLNRGMASRPGELAKKLAIARDRLITYRDRIKSLLSAAMTPDRLEFVCSTLTGRGWTNFSSETLRVGANDSTIGVTFRATRSGSAN